MHFGTKIRELGTQETGSNLEAGGWRCPLGSKALCFGVDTEIRPLSFASEDEPTGLQFRSTVQTSHNTKALLTETRFWDREA